LAFTHAAKGNYQRAIEEFRKGIRTDGEASWTLCYLGYALAKAGYRKEAVDTLTRLKTTREYVSPAELAVLYVGLDKKEEAIALLEKAYAAHDLQMQNLNVDPHYDGLRTDPRFQELVRRVGLRPQIL